jgi:hypothetical protein
MVVIRGQLVYNVALEGAQLRPHILQRTPAVLLVLPVAAGYLSTGEIVAGVAVTLRRKMPMKWP